MMMRAASFPYVVLRPKAPRRISPLRVAAPRAVPVVGRLPALPVQPQQRAPAVRRVVMPQAAPAMPTQTAVPSPVVAVEVGIVGSAATTLTMLPASLLIGPQTNISAFTIVTMDAGTF